MQFTGENGLVAVDVFPDPIEDYNVQFEAVFFNYSNLIIKGEAGWKISYDSSLGSGVIDLADRNINPASLDRLLGYITEQVIIPDVSKGQLFSLVVPTYNQIRVEVKSDYAVRILLALQPKIAKALGLPVNIDMEGSFDGVDDYYILRSPSLLIVGNGPTNFTTPSKTSYFAIAHINNETTQARSYAVTTSHAMTGYELNNLSTIKVIDNNDEVINTTITVTITWVPTTQRREEEIDRVNEKQSTKVTEVRESFLTTQRGALLGDFTKFKAISNPMGAITLFRTITPKRIEAASKALGITPGTSPFDNLELIEQRFKENNIPIDGIQQIAKMFSFVRDFDKIDKAVDLSTIRDSNIERLTDAWQTVKGTDLEELAKGEKFKVNDIIQLGEFNFDNLSREDALDLTFNYYDKRNRELPPQILRKLQPVDIIDLLSIDRRKPQIEAQLERRLVDVSDEVIADWSVGTDDLLDVSPALVERLEKLNLIEMAIPDIASLSPALEEESLAERLEKLVQLDLPDVVITEVDD